MKDDKTAPPDARELRQRAEQKLRKHQALAEQPPSAIDARSLVHELEVHQIELEMQNEELRRAEAQAQEALDKYADLFDFAPLGYFQLTQDGVIRGANLAGGALLGLDRSRVVSGRFAAWVAPACLRTFADFHKAVLASDTRQTCEIQLLCQGRGALDVQLEGLAAPEQAGPKKTWRLAVLDVTLRKQEEAELAKHRENLEELVKERTAQLAAANTQLRGEIADRKQAEEETRRLLDAVQQEKDRISSLLNSISDEVWFADTNKKFTLANPSALREFGLDPAKGIGVEQLAASLEVLRPDGSPRPVEEAPPLRALQGETVRDLEEAVRTPGSGELRYRQVNAAPVRDAQGAIIGAVSVVRDITERKRIEGALRFVAQCGSAASGEDFFRALARYLGQSLGMDYVCIDRLEEGSLAARTVGIYFDGKFEDNVYYTLKDTPCGDAVGKAVCCFPKDVRHLFPKDAVLQQMVAESYVGVTLWGSQGQPIGLIAVLGRQPLADTRLATSILQVVAVRAAAELERRQAEQALRTSEQRYRSLFENMLDGFAYCRMLYENGWPRDFIYLDVNSAFERLTGLKNVTGKKVSEVIPDVQATNPELFEIYGRVALTGQPERFETWLPSLGIWFAIAVYSPSKDHFVAVFDNITERKRAEEALRKSDELLRAVTDNSPDAIYVKDAESRWLMANPAVLRIVGKTAEQALGKTDLELYADPGIGRAIIEKDRRIMEGGQAEAFEEAADTPEGRRTFLSNKVPRRDAQGNIIGIIGISRDITTRKQAERDLFNANQRLEAVMRAVPVGVSFSDDATCQRVTGNPAVLAQFEAAAADNLSASAPDTVAPGRQLRFFREGRPITDAELPLQRAVAENKVIPPMELEVHLPSGRRWFAEASGAPVRGAQGEVVGGLAVTVDITERKRAEEVLRKNEALALSEKEFRLLAEAMPQIVWATRADGWNTYFNQQWVDYTGLSLEESYGHGWNRPFHPDDQQRAWDAWQNAVANRATYVLECRLRRADGTYRWWLIRGVPVLDEQGSILKWFGTCTDINDLKEAEKALREAGEERLRLVLEATSLGTFEVDLRTGEGRWNTVEFELLGLKPGNAPSVPATFFRYLHPEDAARVQAQWAEATQTGILNTEFRIVRADGQVRWLAGLGRFAYAGQPDGSAPEGRPAPERFLGVNFDITERKEMEAALRESESRYRAIGESNDYGVWVCAPDGSNIYASPSFLKLVGLTQEQCSNFGWGDLLHPDDTARTVAAWKECVSTGAKWDMEHRFRGVDGKYHPVLARGVPVRNDKGEIVCWAGINLDISRLKEAEEGVRRRAEELRATNAELLQFNQVMVGRELRMIELKQEINALCAQSGQPLRYPCDFQEEPSPASESP